MKPAILALTICAILTLEAGASAQPVAGPSCADGTPFAFGPLPPSPVSSTWACVAGSWMDHWKRGLSKYDQIGFSAKAGGVFGTQLPSKYVLHLAAGGEIRLFNWLHHIVDVPPAIHETADAQGLGETRLFIQVQAFDSKTWKLKLKAWRIRAAALVRATLPTDTMAGRTRRYPMVAFHRVLGPASRNHRYALLELPGLTASANWKEKFQVQLQWAPLIHGIVTKGPDRFLTHLHAVVSGRPTAILDLGAELFGLWNWNKPYGTSEVLVEGFGVVVSLLLGRWTAQFHVRMSMGDSLETYGFLTVGAGASYRFR